MTGNPKQIVIDKVALVGIGIGALAAFAEDHLLLACDTLLYECATTSNPEEMLGRYIRLVKAGAYYCSCSVAFIQYEGTKCCPYPWFLPDLRATEQIRTGEAPLETASDWSGAEDVFKSRCEVARKRFVELSGRLKNRIDVENPEVGKVIRELPADTFTRFEKQFERIDARDMCEVALDSTPADWIRDKTEYCLSPQWMSWQHLRLTWALVGEYYYLRQMGGVPGGERPEHDYQDMEYVLLLSRADALVTGDKKLAKPLAHAAFPDKDVYSSLDDVPDKYRIDWS